MVKLIGSRHSWPIVTEAQIEGLRDPSRFRLNPYGTVTGPAGSRPQGISKIFSSPPVSPPQQQTANRKGHPALTSTVFGHLKNSNDDLRRATNQLPLSPSTSDESIASKNGNGVATKKGHPALTSTLFNHLDKTNPNQYDQENSTSRRTDVVIPPSTRNEGSIASVTSAPTKKGHPALTSTLFSHLKDQPQSTTTTTTRSTRQEEQEEQQRIQKELEERGAGWRPDYVKPKGHPALTSSIFSKAAPTSAPAPTRSIRQEQEQEQEQEQQRQQQQQQQQVPESERGAGWRADYVKPKGHPALTSSIFSKGPSATPAATAPVRKFKKTSHNIFGAPQSAQTSSQSSAQEENEEQQQQQQQQQEEEEEEETQEQYTLEPSAIEAELERNEELQDEIRRLENPSVTSQLDADEETLRQLEKQIQEQEELNAQEEKLAEQLKQAELEKTVVNNNDAPLSPLSPARTPPQSTKRVHPNYRTTFTIG
ncbi:hypothetical protein BGZ76_010469 [Entomortierella beljakovae]|nr:hypothetical protein BGZ76_010469 [Entomortierella beljakovae]